MAQRSQDPIGPIATKVLAIVTPNHFQREATSKDETQIAASIIALLKSDADIEDMCTGTNIYGKNMLHFLAQVCSFQIAKAVFEHIRQITPANAFVHLSALCSKQTMNTGGPIMLLIDRVDIIKNNVTRAREFADFFHLMLPYLPYEAMAGGLFSADLPLKEFLKNGQSFLFAKKMVLDTLAQTSDEELKYVANLFNIDPFLAKTPPATTQSTSTSTSTTTNDIRTKIKAALVMQRGPQAPESRMFKTPHLKFVNGGEVRDVKTASKVYTRYNNRGGLTKPSKSVLKVFAAIDHLKDVLAELHAETDNATQLAAAAATAVVPTDLAQAKDFAFPNDPEIQEVTEGFELKDLPDSKVLYYTGDLVMAWSKPKPVPNVPSREEIQFAWGHYMAINMGMFPLEATVLEGGDYCDQLRDLVQ
jgi:hypothetical protein